MNKWIFKFNDIYNKLISNSQRKNIHHHDHNIITIHSGHLCLHFPGCPTICYLHYPQLHAVSCFVLSYWWWAVVHSHGDGHNIAPRELSVLIPCPCVYTGQHITVTLAMAMVFWFPLYFSTSYAFRICLFHCIKCANTHHANRSCWW